MSKNRRRPLCGSHGQVVLVIATALLVAGAGVARAQPASLVREMVAALGAMNAVGEAVAVGDFERVERAAGVLEATARELRSVEPARVGLGDDNDTLFDAYLRTQETVAGSMRAAAKAEDAQQVMLVRQRMLDEACLACHERLRARYAPLRPPVAIMLSFLSSWREIERGLLINDYALVEEHAAEIGSAAGLFAHEHMVVSVFGVDDPEDIAQYRRLLRVVQSRARQIQNAAGQSQPAAVTGAVRQMWVEGCLACHEAYR